MSQNEIMNFTVDQIAEYIMVWNEAILSYLLQDETSYDIIFALGPYNKDVSNWGICDPVQEQKHRKHDPRKQTFSLTHKPGFGSVESEGT